MAIMAGTCVGVLYFKQGNGTWIVGVHNGRTNNTVTSKIGVRIATKVTASTTAHGCIAFLQNGTTAPRGEPRGAPEIPALEL